MNRQIFQRLKTDAVELERAVGHPLNWDFDPQRLGQIVTVNKDNVSRDKPAELPLTARWAAQMLAALRSALEPRLTKIVPDVLHRHETAGTT